MFVNALHHYQHPIHKVIDTFMDPAFYRAKFAAVGARNIEVVSSRREQDGFGIVTTREVPLEVPGMLRSFLGAWNVIRQSERWQPAGDEYRNDLAIDAAGVPVALRGTMVLRPDGDACVNDVRMEIRCDVPLVGARLAAFVCENTQRGLADEHRVITDYLARH